MTALATIERKPRSVLVDMADRYGMEPAAFEATLRATVCKGNVSREEFAAFLVVAKEHRLNPLTKEIYAFPAKGGGIQPIVSIDGWARIINEHPQLDGIEFDDHLDDTGALTAITCRIWRKDRRLPVLVTEYMAECRRQTDTWRTWPARMLRHKALIQCARYAFGFSGIVDPDEFERMESVRDVTPRESGLRARLEARQADNSGGFDADHVERETASHDPETGEVPEAEFTATEALDGDKIPEEYGGDPEFPGDAKPAGVITGAQLAERQSKTLAERLEAFKAYCADPTLTVDALKALEAKASALWKALDDRDPDLLAEAREWISERMDQAEVAERG